MSDVKTVDEMVARLHSLEDSLQIGDGVRWFNRLLLEVTLPVREVLAHAHLAAPPFLERLDVFIGNAYFDALAGAQGGDGGVPRAWAPLFDARHDPRIAPLQFALAGMNAHINHDLAIGTVVTCRALGMAPGSAQQHDFQAVNAVVTETEARVKRWLLTGAVKELDHLVAPADDLAAIWSLGRARAAAWVRAQVLWHLRGEPDISAAWIAVNDRATELAGRALLLPLPYAGAQDPLR
ncbi:MAG: DUF5995 family protein [Actinomycetota bacterium]|nr:DUF5995 family protein [Actinomycetota bacterium]